MTGRTIPQNTANLFTSKFRNIIFFSILTGFLGAMFGLVISWYLNIPSGASIIFSLTVIYLLARIVKYSIGQSKSKES